MIDGATTQRQEKTEKQLKIGNIKSKFRELLKILSKSPVSHPEALKLLKELPYSTASLFFIEDISVNKWKGNFVEITMMLAKSGHPEYYATILPNLNPKNLYEHLVKNLEKSYSKENLHGTLLLTLLRLAKTFENEREKYQADHKPSTQFALQLLDKYKNACEKIRQFVISVENKKLSRLPSPLRHIIAGEYLYKEFEDVLKHIPIKFCYKSFNIALDHNFTYPVNMQQDENNIWKTEKDLATQSYEFVVTLAARAYRHARPIGENWNKEIEQEKTKELRERIQDALAELNKDKLIPDLLNKSQRQFIISSIAKTNSDKTEIIEAVKKAVNTHEHVKESFKELRAKELIPNYLEQKYKPIIRNAIAKTNGTKEEIEEVLLKEIPNPKSLANTLR